jgi:hypothetical protein
LSGAPKELKKTQLDQSDNIGAIIQKEKTFETKQISEKYHVLQIVNNNSTYVVQRDCIEVPCENRLNMDLAYRK